MVSLVPAFSESSSFLLGKLQQVVHEPPRVALNVKSASAIVPTEILGMSTPAFSNMPIYRY